jgi:hypothetical protein
MAGGRWRRPAAGDDEIVPEGLSEDGAVDRFVQLYIGRRRSNSLPQVHPIVLSKTHEKRPVARYPDPITGFAEIVGERGDESETAAGLGDTNVPRRTTSRIGKVDKRVTLLARRIS